VRAGVRGCVEECDGCSEWPSSECDGLRWGMVFTAFYAQTSLSKTRPINQQNPQVMTMRSVFGDNTRMLGKLRVRASTLAPNVPVNCKLPLQGACLLGRGGYRTCVASSTSGSLTAHTPRSTHTTKPNQPSHQPTHPPPGERTNLRGGRPRVATADLFLLLRAPSTPTWLTAYARVPVPRPLLLAAALAEPPQPLDALSAAERRAAVRWLLERLPPGQQLPARALARVPDDGRGEFTLSRTRHNWRRLMAARAWAAGTLGAAFVHVCEWNSVWHSGGVAATVVLLGVYPSQTLALLLVVLAALLWRRRGGVSGGSSSGGGTDHRQRPPPMEADIALPDEDGGDGVAVPADPYTALKQNYDAVVGFTTTVSVFGGPGAWRWACS